MSYANQAALAADKEFEARVTSCCVEQALVYQNDGRPDIAGLARVVIAEPSNAHGVFVLVCVAPGFGDSTDSSAIDDPSILSAVQAQWPTYAAVMFPQPEPPAGETP